MAHFSYREAGESYSSSNLPVQHGIYGLLGFVGDATHEEPDHFLQTRYAMIAREQGFEDPFDALSCFLDVIYVWLVEGDATLRCPTFEVYLMTIIAAVDRFSDTEIALRRRSDEQRPFYMFYWADDRPLNEETVGMGHGWIDRELAAQAESHGDAVGYGHPALRKDLYEHFKREHEEERQRRALRLAVEHTAGIKD